MSVKLYTADDMSQWIWAKVINGKREVVFDLRFDRQAINQAMKGTPLQCILAREVMRQAEKFPHPVLGAYVIGSTIYVITRIGQPRHSGETVLVVRYRHNFAEEMRAFDNLTKRQFANRFADTTTSVHLKPTHRQHANGGGGGGGGGGRPAGPSGPPIGAARRARDAGLVGLETRA